MADRADEELKNASHHLFYEYSMMRSCVAILPSKDGVLSNAVLESFLVHVRNIVVFLGWHSSNHKEDVLAKHYIANFVPRPPQDEWLSELYEAVSTRVVHLSFARSKVDLFKRDWPIREIVETVSAELERVVSLVQRHLLDELWLEPRGPAFSEYSQQWPSVPTMLTEAHVKWLRRK